MRKRIMSLVLVLLMVFALMPTLSTQANAQTGGHTQAEAVAWAQSQDGESLDYDQVYGAQCVDLIKYYYAYLGGNAGYAHGNANEYAWNDLPSGWTRVYGNYQPGDIAVFKVNHSSYNSNGSLVVSTGSLGHVSIITSVSGSWFYSMNQNFNNHSYVESKNFPTDIIDCAIRPDFASADPKAVFYDQFNQLRDSNTVVWVQTSVRMENANISDVTGCGIYLYDSHDNQIAYFDEPVSRTGSYMNVHYGIGAGEELNVTLNPGTMYKYKIFVNACGRTFYDEVRSFTTGGSSVNLDVNGLLDGTSYGSLKDYGTVDVYVKGKLVANDVSDYCTSEHYGSTYEIKDIKAKDGYTYKGVASGSLTGTIYGSTVNVVLKFDKIDSFAPDSNSLPSDYYGLLVQASPWMHVNVNGDNMELADSTAYIPTHIFRYVEQSDGSYKIICEYDGRVLTASSNGSTAGTNVELAADYGWDGQRWFIHDNGDGTFVLTPKSNKDVALSVEGGASSVAGTNVRLWNRNGNAAQNFSPYILSQDVTYVKPSKPAASSVITTEAAPGTAVNIQWTPSPLVNAWDARTYMLTVKDSSGSIILAKTNLTGTSYSFTFPSAGTYTAQVIAVNTMYYDYMTVGTAGTITVKKTPQPNPFIDVAAGKFYYEPVLWAISQDPQITTGVTPTTFVPDRICTRAHVVTFLWRANGCPDPQSMTSKFKDVKDTSKYYYKAVLWANEQGITTGYSDGTFRPDDECTRGQVVTFLWRAKGSPAPTGVTNPFSDVPTGKYYTNAVLWALKNNITKGRTATTFGPDDACTRGHVVTFLYRAYAD